MSEIMSTYQPAILAACLLCLIVLVQSFLGSIFGLVQGGNLPGGKFKGDYGDFGFRTIRTHLNSVENLSAFVLALLLAIVASAPAEWVNNLAVAHVVARAIYWLIYYKGIGPNETGPRTIVFVTGWGLNLALAIVALVAIIQY